jgi:hypothetical protein
MGLPTDIDLAGNTLIVKDIKTGYRDVNQQSDKRQVTAAGSTLTVNRNTHSGRTILLDTATGSVVTLPAASGTGDTYRFVTTVSVTSNNHIIKVANASDTMVGSVGYTSGAAVGTSVIGDSATGTDDTITMNGTTSGGLQGTWYDITDVASNLWFVAGSNAYSGNAVAIFSATV